MPWTKPYRPAANQRLDPALYTRPEEVYFLTLRTHAGATPFTRPALCTMAVETLLAECARLECIVFSYCLMPDHLHFLISPNRGGVSVLMFANQYKGKTTNRSWALGWEGRLWQPRYYDHIVRRDEDLRAIVQYVAENPVRKGLAAAPAAWPWSGTPTPLPL